jgi:ABC-2 type transport system permease protein
MHRILLRFYLHQSWLLFIALALLLFFFAWVRVWANSLFDMEQFRTIIEQFRQFERFAPVEFESLFTYVGRVGMTYDEPVVILCVVIWCLARGSDCVSGELGRGTMEMLLAQPISRRQLLVSHASISLLGLVGLCLVTWLGIYVGVQNTSIEESLPGPRVTIPWLQLELPLSSAEPERQTVPMSQRVDVSMMAAPTFHLFTFGCFILGLSTLISSLDRYRWRTIGIVVGFYVVQLVMFGLSKATPRLEWLANVTFFSCYKPQKMVTLAESDSPVIPWSLVADVEGIAMPPLAYPLILLGLSATCYALADSLFKRRDIPAP